MKIGSFKSAVKCLKEGHNNVGIESRLPEVDEFFLGKIIDVTDQYVSLKPYDATGKWESGICKIPYKDITSIKFDDEYSNIFMKYVK